MDDCVIGIRIGIIEAVKVAPDAVKGPAAQRVPAGLAQPVGCGQRGVQMQLLVNIDVRSIAFLRRASGRTESASQECNLARY